jgi:hypothetical protein
MEKTTICNILGWSILISSWIAPYFITNKKNARLLGMVLSAFAVGIFVANGIHMFI